MSRSLFDVSAVISCVISCNFNMVPGSSHVCISVLPFVLFSTKKNLSIDYYNKKWGFPRLSVCPSVRPSRPEGMIRGGAKTATASIGCERGRQLPLVAREGGMPLSLLQRARLWLF
jgi:hypothetical protein